MTVNEDTRAAVIGIALVILIGIGLYIGALRYDACRETTGYAPWQCLLMSGR